MGKEPQPVPATEQGCHGELLEPCPREDAQPASVVKQSLQKLLGEDATAIVLEQYTNKVMRVPGGKPQRYFVDATGATVKLVHHKNVALQ